jgi:ubiquinone/menaquinone biosynthesis C-methylase UbiE
MELTGFGRIADLYDTFVQADFDIPFFLKETSMTSGEVLELMSGTGRVSIPLVQAGVRLTCVDKSSRMLDVLRQKLVQRRLSAQVVAMDVCELDLGRRFDLIIIPFYSFSEITSPDDQRQALARIHRHLSPTGRFICTLGNLARARPADGQLRLFSKHPLPNGQGTLLYWLLAQVDPSDPHIVEHMEFFEEYDAAGILKSKRLLQVQSRHVSRVEFQEMAEAAGFRITALYGDYDYAEFREGTSAFMVWVLEKAKST